MSGARAEPVEALRAQVDALDDAIAQAVLRRRALVARLREEKARRGAAFLDPAREAVIAARYRDALPGLSDPQVEALVRAVLGACR